LLLTRREKRRNGNLGVDQGKRGEGGRSEKKGVFVGKKKKGGCLHDSDMKRKEGSESAFRTWRTSMSKKGGRSLEKQTEINTAGVDSEGQQTSPRTRKRPYRNRLETGEKGSGPTLAEKKGRVIEKNARSCVPHTRKERAGGPFPPMDGEKTRMKGESKEEEGR